MTVNVLYTSCDRKPNILIHYKRGPRDFKCHSECFWLPATMKQQFIYFIISHNKLSGGAGSARMGQVVGIFLVPHSGNSAIPFPFSSSWSQGSCQISRCGIHISWSKTEKMLMGKMRLSFVREEEDSMSLARLYSTVMARKCLLKGKKLL